ncbi:hypothetical protein BDF22DRAFT_439467 [Syncephalis plumigaleata]|nr:hypothetical protein BDF22DRAFT_439467 [Syncephalis plumigaleata]
MIHLLLLTGFLVWGTHVSGMHPWECAIRKGVYVYAAQGAELLSAMVIIRLWMSTFGYLPSTGPQVYKFERQTVVVGLGLTLVPALLASLPQIISQDYTSDLARLNKCSSGYIKTWQVIASGAAFSIPIVLTSILALAAISWRVGFLLFYRKKLVSKQQSREALKVALTTLVRVVLFFISIGTIQIYYIVADFLVINQTPGTALGESTSTNHGNRFGHFMLSIWGTVMFLIFNTSRQSLWVLRTSCRKRVHSQCDSSYHHDNSPDGQVYAGLRTSTSPDETSETHFAYTSCHHPATATTPRVARLLHVHPLMPLKCKQCRLLLCHHVPRYFLHRVYLPWLVTNEIAP